MLDEPSTATSRGVSNWPFAVPYVPNVKSGDPVAEKTSMRSFPVSATTRRLSCASQVRPLGYIAAGDAGGPASVFRNVAGVVEACTALDRGADTSTAAIVEAEASSASGRFRLMVTSLPTGLNGNPNTIELRPPARTHQMSCRQPSNIRPDVVRHPRLIESVGEKPPSR